jgi:hypothetical protein
MAARLENALVLNADKAHPIPVARDPGREAVARKIGAWYTSPAERKKLFETTYSPAWGSARVAPDAFLTGEVKCSGDMTKTTVTIEMFTKAAPEKLVPVTQFTVDTDRVILADLGAHFNVARRGIATKRAVELDRFAIGQARRRDSTTADNYEVPDQPSTTNDGSKPTQTDSITTTDYTTTPVETLTDLGGINFQLMADDEPQTIRRATTSTASWEVTSPDAAAKVKFVLKNTSAKRLGVVLKLNGQSTFHEESADPAQCKKWVIGPGEQSTIKGFYLDGDKVAPFKVLVGDEAAQAGGQFGDRAKQIQIAVFDESPVVDVIVDASGPPPVGATERSLSLPRRLPASETAVRRDLSSLQDAMMKSQKLKKETKTEMVGGKAIKREIIVANKDYQETASVKEVDFKAAPEPVACELIQIMKR